MRPECARAAGLYALALPRAPFAGVMGGARMGQGVGSSIEFMDDREYRPGDDLRHVDWRAYARTDQMRVRLYREEIAPLLDVVVDTSASMAVTPEKEQAVRDLCAALGEWLRAAAGRDATRLYAAGGGRIDDVRELTFGGDVSEPDALVPLAPLRARGLRLVISDFLTPHDPAFALRRLAAGGSHLYVVHLLDPWEVDPSADGPRTLIDAESGERLELSLDAVSLQGYRERLARLRAGLTRAVRRVGGTLASVTADVPERMFRRDLLPAGLIEAR